VVAEKLAESLRRGMAIARTNPSGTHGAMWALEKKKWTDTMYTIDTSIRSTRSQKFTDKEKIKFPSSTVIVSIVSHRIISTRKRAQTLFARARRFQRLKRRPVLCEHGFFALHALYYQRVAVPVTPSVLPRKRPVPGRSRAKPPVSSRDGTGVITQLADRSALD